jgi:hypothetical protein
MRDSVSAAHWLPRRTSRREPEHLARHMPSIRSVVAPTGHANCSRGDAGMPYRDFLHRRRFALDFCRNRTVKIFQTTSGRQ